VIISGLHRGYQEFKRQSDESLNPTFRADEQPNWAGLLSVRNKDRTKSGPLQAQPPLVV
jgi:hypothetical protein